MLSWVGPRSLSARSKQREVNSARRSGRFTWAWNLVIFEKIGIWSVSWKPPMPWVALPVSGVITTTGECAQ